MSPPFVYIVLIISMACVMGALGIAYILSLQLQYRTQELDELKGQVLEWNRRLEQRVSERTKLLEEAHKKIQDTYLQTVTSLVEAMTAKDTYLYSHSHNVATNATVIAQELGFSKERMQRLQHGCELHDLGKIAVPDRILLKPGPLTDEEYDIIKLHPVWGARILGPLTFMRDITEMVHQEHERWDGNGYPLGLQGEQIRMEARIIAVADALDAMVCDRPYRQRITLEKACEEIERCSGTQFDPQVVEAFLQSFRKGNLTVDAHPHPEDSIRGYGSN